MERKEQIGHLFESEHQHLLASIRAAFPNVDLDVSEDAAAFAWTMALATESFDPQHEAAFAWLVTTATRHALRVIRRPDVDLDATAALTVPDPIDLDEWVDFRMDAAAFAKLTDNQRLALTHFIAGLSYDEIAERLGKSKTWVNRHITEGRAAWRRLRE